MTYLLILSFLICKRGKIVVMTTEIILNIPNVPGAILSFVLYYPLCHFTGLDPKAQGS